MFISLGSCFERKKREREKRQARKGKKRQEKAGWYRRQLSDLEKVAGPGSQQL